MSNFRVIDPDVKEQAIEDVRNKGLTVKEAAAKYGVDPRTIYGWLQKNVVNGERNLILENNRLKKEIEQLYNLLGRATVELKRPKN
jgi:transposase-like protein